jgi:hypothetical protein
MKTKNGARNKDDGAGTPGTDTPVNHNSPRRKSVPPGRIWVVADSAVRKRRVFVRICLVLAGGLFGTEAVLYTSN